MPIYSDRKCELLDEFEGIVHLENREAISCLIKRGRRTEPRVVECANRLDCYWDTVSDAVLQPPIDHCDFARTVMLGWVAKTCGDRRLSRRAPRRAVNLRKSFAAYFPIKRRVAVHHQLSFLKNRAVAALQWTVRIGTAPTAEPKAGIAAPPAHADGVGAGNLERRVERLLKLQRIAEQKMETEPYQWKFIDGLFSVEDAALLATSFPCDKFKRVAGHDQEKGYKYMSRSLIHMGAAAPRMPGAWARHGVRWQANCFRRNTGPHCPGLRGGI